eukprot:1158202-Pelagomonas_calceolata.AAC.6
MDIKSQSPVLEAFPEPYNRSRCFPLPDNHIATHTTGTFVQVSMSTAPTEHGRIQLLLLHKSTKSCTRLISFEMANS